MRDGLARMQRNSSGRDAHGLQTVVTNDTSDRRELGRGNKNLSARPQLNESNAGREGRHMSVEYSRLTLDFYFKGQRLIGPE